MCGSPRFAGRSTKTESGAHQYALRQRAIPLG
jgi:hypothetical protein